MGCLMTVVYSAKGVCCIPITHPHYIPIDPKAQVWISFTRRLNWHYLQVVKNGGRHFRQYYKLTFQERKIKFSSKTWSEAYYLWHCTCLFLQCEMMWSKSVTVKTSVNNNQFRENYLSALAWEAKVDCFGSVILVVEGWLLGDLI